MLLCEALYDHGKIRHHTYAVTLSVPEDEMPSLDQLLSVFLLLSFLVVCGTTQLWLGFRKGHEKVISESH